MKMTINADGSAVVTNEDEGRVNAPAGDRTEETPAVSSWRVSDADQLGKFARGMDDVKRQPRKGTEDHPWANLSKGDKDAARDAANEARKQIES